jgi:phage terminase large subunit GpA-like protein
MIRHGIVESFENLEGFLTEDFRDIDGNVYRISNGLIDSGGTRRGWQKHSRTTQIYEWCSRFRQMQPIKGAHGRKGNLVSYSARETYPNSNTPIPGGIKLINLRVDIFKDALDNRLHTEPDDPGALSFHYDIDSSFAKHYTAEVKDAFGDWQHNRKHRNDFWDCTVYALALLEIMPIPNAPIKRIKPVKTQAVDIRSTPNWFNKRR